MSVGDGLSLDGRECVIRDHDYYGGDLTAEIRATWNDYEEKEIAIEWCSWGNYGSCEIVLSLEEAAKLHNALTRFLGLSTEPA